MDYKEIESKVLELEKRSSELEEFQKVSSRSLRNVKNSPIIMGYEGKRFDLNESLDVVKLLGRVRELEDGEGLATASWFDSWLAGPPKVSLFENDVGYLTAMSEVDPVFMAWVGSSPDISLFTNNVGYLKLNDDGVVNKAAIEDSGNWDSAYGWGDHSGLYAPISGIGNTNLGNLGTQNTVAKFGATGLADSLISETGTTINASCYDFIIPTTTTTLARFMFLHPTWPTIWQNGIEMNWSAVPKITNVFSYSDVSDGLITLCVGTRAVPKICMMLRGGAGGEAVYDGNIGFGTTSIGQMQNSMITCMRSGNGPTAGSAWPGMEFTNTLATKGDGVTTFNYAGLKFKAGNSTVNSIFLNVYDDGYSGMLFGTYSNHPTAVETNGVVRQTWAANGNVGIGTTSPGYLLTVGGGSTRGIAKIDGGTSDVPSIILADSRINGKNWILYSGSPNLGYFSIYDITQNSYPFVIQQSTGNVGIGTIAPAAKTQINKVGIDTLTTANAGLVIADMTNHAGLAMQQTSSAPYAFTLQSRDERAGSEASVYPLALNPDGSNVGIGTIVPTSKLQVVGLPTYANNAAALAGGLTAGAFYRTGGDPDPVCVVH